MVVHKDFRSLGGGEAVAAFIIEALGRENSVSVLSWSPVPVDPINRMFGTNLSVDLQVIPAPLLLRALVKLMPFLSLLKLGILLRQCKKMARGFDLIISTFNEADFGRIGIQYVHDPPYWLYPISPPDSVFPCNLWASLTSKRRPWMFLCGFSYERMKRNVTLTNSNWTAKKLQEIYGIESEIVYPPVLGCFPEVIWDKRENGFVCLGRIVPCKRIEEIINIVRRTRSKFPDTHLHIVGHVLDDAYYKRLLRLAQDADWIHVNENVSRQELMQLITTHRYGIHGMINESFGMAVAEMICGGCIVFVPRSGGPAEIVGDDRLLFGSTEEAVAKITRVIQNGQEQASLREYLSVRRDLFSRERFVNQMQEIAGRFMSGKDSHLSR